MNQTAPSSVARPANGFATASLILGILSLSCPCAGCLTAIPGVVCGHLALRQSGQPGMRRSGRDLAIVGLVISYVGVLVALVVPCYVILKFVLMFILMFGIDCGYLFQDVT
jgi:hypothetical protein